jgi:hypothetical protein
MYDRELHSSALYIRMPPIIAPGLCRISDMNFREFLFYALG